MAYMRHYSAGNKLLTCSNVTAREAAQILGCKLADVPSAPVAQARPFANQSTRWAVIITEDNVRTLGEVFTDQAQANERFDALVGELRARAGL